MSAPEESGQPQNPSNRALVVPAASLPPPPAQPGLYADNPEPAHPPVDVLAAQHGLGQRIDQLEAEVRTLHLKAAPPSGVTWLGVSLIALVPLIAVIVLAWRGQRCPAPLPGAAPVVINQQKLTFHKWKKGQHAVRLIRADEGFCFLTSVKGHFQGGAEFVYVRVEDDGYWHFGGNALSYELYGECAVYRYDNVPAK